MPITVYAPEARKAIEAEYQAQRLATAIERSGLTQTEFATRILSRDESTIRRWLTTTSPMPKAVTEWLDHWYTLSEGTRRRVTGALAPKQEPSNASRFPCESEQ